MYNLHSGFRGSLVEKSHCGLYIPPGIATFSKSPETAFTSIQPLLAFALSHIPASQHPHTVLYIFGTAGMRLLPKEQQGRIVEVLYERVLQEYPFHLPKDGVQVISGKMEGEGVAFIVQLWSTFMAFWWALLEIARIQMVRM